MKSQNFILASIFLASVAQAAPTATANKAAPPTAPVQASTAGLGGGAPAASTPATTSTVSAAEVKPTKRVGADFLLWGYQKTSLVNYGGENVDAYNQLGLSYKFDNGVKVAVKQGLTGVWGDGGQTDWFFNDPFIAVSKGNLAQLPGGFSMTGQARVYIPTTANSANNETIQTRFYGWFNKDLGNGYGFEYFANPRYYYQGKHQSSAGNGNNHFLFLQYAKIDKTLGKYFSTYFQGGTNHYVTYSSPASSEKYSDSWTMETGVDFKATEQITVSAAIDQERSMSGPTGSFVPFNDNGETNYNLIISGSF